MKDVAPTETVRRRGSAAQTRTRDLLLDAAEDLFARRGVDAVPLREIAAAAGQRNNAAVYYHFGDKQGLIDALIGDRMSRIEKARSRWVDDIDLSTAEIPHLLKALWQPVLDEGQAKSVSWFIQFRLSAQFQGESRSLTDFSYSDAFPASRHLHAALAAKHPDLPPALFAYRMNLVAMMFWSAVSWHEAAAAASNQKWSTRFSLDQVIKLATAALAAPG